MSRRRSGRLAQMATTSGETKVNWLRRSAALLRENTKRLQTANAQDLDAAPGYGLTAAADRPPAADASGSKTIAKGLEDSRRPCPIRLAN